MKLINADYLTGRIFTEADLTNAHTCYDSIMAIIENMESEDVLDRIKAMIEQIADVEQKHDEKWAMGLRYAVKIIDKYRNEVSE